MLSDKDAGRLADRLLSFWMEGDEDRSSAAIDRLADTLSRIPLVPEHDIDQFVDSGNYRAFTPNPFWSLSASQLAVLQGLADGKRDEEIALELGLKVTTVRAYIQRSVIRLRCETRSQAVAVAVSAGLVTVPMREDIVGDKLNVKRILLTKRQSQVLRMSALGMTRTEIAETLGIDEETVKNHFKKLFAVLGARNQPHAIAIAFGTGRLAFSDSRHTGR